jgi:hypothetical protein
MFETIYTCLNNLYFENFGISPVSIYIIIFLLNSYLTCFDRISLHRHTEKQKLDELGKKPFIPEGLLAEVMTGGPGCPGCKRKGLRGGLPCSFIRKKGISKECFSTPLSQMGKQIQNRGNRERRAQGVAAAWPAVAAAAWPARVWGGGDWCWRRGAAHDALKGKRR